MADMKLASGGDNVKLWDIRGYGLVKQFNPHGQNISSLCWSHDNSALASASTGGDKVVFTYPNAGFSTKDVQSGEKTTCVDFNSSSRYLLSGGPSGCILVWDIKTHKVRKYYKDHKGPVTSLHFNWNDTVIASGSERGEIILYNVVTGLGYSPLIAPKVQAVRQLQYSQFKKSLLGAVSDDGAVNLWDTNTKRLIHSFNEMHKAPATGLAFSPLNEMLMMSVGLDKRIVCYDVQGKTAVKTMTAESPLTSIDLLYDGSTIAVGSTRGKIYIYDLRQGEEPVTVITAHKSSVQTLRFQANLSKARSDVVGGTARPSKRTTSNPALQARRAQFETPTNNNIPPSQTVKSNRAATNGMSTSKSTPELDGYSKEELDRPSRVNFSERHQVAGSPLAEQFTNRSRVSGFGEFISPLRETTSQGYGQSGSDGQSGSYGQGDMPGQSGTYGQSGSPESEEHLNNHQDSLLVPITQPMGRISNELFSPLAANTSNRSNNNLSSPSSSSLGDTYGGQSRVSSSPPQRESPDRDHGAKSRPRTMGYENRLPADKYNPHANSIGKKPVGKSSSSSRESSLSSSHGDSSQGLEDQPGGRSLPGEGRTSHHPGRDEGRSGSRTRESPLRQSPSYPAEPSDTANVRSPSSHSSSGAEPPPREAWAPSQGEEPGAVGGADSASGAALTPFHTQFIRNMIEDAMEEFRDQVRQHILNLHMEMLKQFQVQQTEIRTMLQHYSVNEQLIAEVERLKEENRRLKKKF